MLHLKRFFLLLCTLLLWPCVAQALTDQTWHQGTIQTWISNATDVTNNSLILGSSVTITNAGYMLGDCEIFVSTFAAAPAASTAITVWFIAQIDGTNFEDGGSGVTPARFADITFPLRPVATAQRIIRREIPIPAGLFKPLVKNEGGPGATMQGSTGGVPWTLKCLVHTPQQ